MLIDWFTVGAQVVNFLILLALLKFFLYDRILRAMDAREKAVLGKLTAAEAARRAAEEERRALTAQREDAERQAEAVLHQARQEAETEKQRLVELARTEAKTRKQRWLEAVAREREVFLDTLRRRAARTASETARRILAELAETDLGDRVAEVFQRKLQDLPPADKQAVANASSWVLRAAFELTPARREAITAVLRGLSGKDMALSCHADPDMVLGIALRADSATIAWSVDEYLDSLEARYEDLLGKPTDTADLDQAAGGQPAAGHSAEERAVGIET